MKIAFVVGDFPVLAETPFLNQITGLIDQGYEVHIFSFERGDTKKMHSDIQKYGLLEKTTYLDPLSSISDRIRDTRLALDEKFFKKIGFRLSSFELSRFVRNSISALILLQFCWSHLNKKGAYDIVHCQMGTVGLRFLPFHRLRLLGGKLIVQFRGEDITGFVRQKGSKIYQELFEFGDYFLPVCDYLRKRAVELGCPENKIFVLRSSVDLKCFKFIERRKPMECPIKILFVGRLVEMKGLEYVIRALQILIKLDYNVELLIVGDGVLRKSLEALSRKLNIEKKITFLGAKNHDQIVEILNTAHLFVAPSVRSGDGSEEGIPNVLKEAMAVGIPVVSAYHAGIPELVKDGISGFLVPERDPQALADRLGYLIDHPKRWSEMGRAGRSFVEKYYDKEKLNEELVDIYKSLTRIV